MKDNEKWSNGGKCLTRVIKSRLTCKLLMVFIISNMACFSALTLENFLLLVDEDSEEVPALEVEAFEGGGGGDRTLWRSPTAGAASPEDQRTRPSRSRATLLVIGISPGKWAHLLSKTACDQ